MAEPRQEQTTQDYSLTEELEFAAKTLFEAHTANISARGGNLLRQSNVLLNENIRRALEISANACRELKRKYETYKLAQIEELLNRLPSIENVCDYVCSFAINYEDTLKGAMDGGNQTVDEDKIEQCGRTVKTCLTMRRLEEQLRHYRKLKALDGIL